MPESNLDFRLPSASALLSCYPAIFIQMNKGDKALIISIDQIFSSKDSLDKLRGFREKATE